jgi:hypothetical protein
MMSREKRGAGKRFTKPREAHLTTLPVRQILSEDKGRAANLWLSLAVVRLMQWTLVDKSDLGRTSVDDLPRF